MRAAYELSGLAARRLGNDERYVAGGEALQHSSEADRAILVQSGLVVESVRELRAFVEVLVRGDDQQEVLVQWVRDSAFRFFPLQMHPELGLTLHPFDLATNKVLALVGRVEVRDWVDVLTCHERLSPLGCLAWAAAGKDLGLTPLFILDEAARTAHYSKADVDGLLFDGAPPSPVALTTVWRQALSDARAIVDALPPERVGSAILTADLVPFNGSVTSLRDGIRDNTLSFHEGRIGGVLPSVRPRGLSK